MSKNHKVALAVSIFILALTASLLWFKISLHSDSLFLDSFAKDLFNQNGRWSDWRFSPAPAYFPDMLLYFFAYKILPNAYGRIFFVSVAQVFILAFAVTWTSKQIYPKISGAALAALLLLISFTTLVASRSGMWLYFYTTNNHFASLAVSLICIGLVIRFYIKPTIIGAALLILIGAIAKASTAIYLISFFVPATVLTVLVLIVAVNSTWRRGVYLGRIFLILCIFIASYAISLQLESILTFNNPLEGRVSTRFESVGNSLNLFLQATVNAFSCENKSTFIFSSLVFVSLLHFLYRFLKGITLNEIGVVLSLDADDDVTDDRWRIAVCNALLLTVIPINVLGAVLSGGFADIYGYRYLAFPIALMLILMVVAGDKISLFSSRKRKYGFILICLTFAILSIQVYRGSSSVASRPLGIANCLNDIEKDGFDLKEGMADYWNARGVSEYLPNKNWIVATVNNMNPFFWMSSIGPIRRIDNYKYKYNFAVINSMDNAGQFDYTSLTIGKLLPDPSQVYRCVEAKAEIWLYGDDKLNSVLEGAFSRFLWGKKMGDTYQIEGKMLPGNTGNSVGLARSAEDSKDNAGFLSFGPYVDLDEGRYEISVKYSTKGPMESTVGYVDIGQFSTPEANLLYKRFVKANAAGNLTALIDIPANGISKFEVRTWFSGVGSMTVESIKISKVRTF